MVLLQSLKTKENKNNKSKENKLNDTLLNAPRIDFKTF